MKRETCGPFIAAAVGNTSLRLGLFDRVVAQSLPEPSDTFVTPSVPFQVDVLPSWCRHSDLPWYIASVRRDVTRMLHDWLGAENSSRLCRTLHHTDFPLAIDVEQPERVGVDRLAAAVAVNRLRSPERAAIFVDSGTALTVNLIDQSGTFLGGAILPGMHLAASALARETDLLPRILVEDLDERVDALGRSTAQAIRSGLLWGATGAVRELVARLKRHVTSEPEVFLTGGGIRPIVGQLGEGTRYVNDLVIRGVAATAVHLRDTLKNDQ